MEDTLRGRDSRVNPGMNEKCGWLSRVLALNEIAVRIDDDQITRPHFRPVKSLRVEQKLIGLARHEQTEVIADALTEAQPIRPTQRSGKIDARLPNCVFSR